ncbi:MAG: stage II sporulation protein M [Bacteroidetes Order II. Incertae sedis bacterium]|nr:stage II sporulation protein M [Bacteroidetes Order II. bacterium]
MREVVFLRQNADKWKKYESLYEQNSQVSADALTEVYLELTDDLAYAKTYYPNSKTTEFLNVLTGKYHRFIYQNKREDKNRLIRFWADEVPEMMYAYRYNLLLAFGIFMLAVGIGVVSVLEDERFVRIVLGDAYVDMTLDNIAKGDPMGVYKFSGEWDMFFSIAYNNVMVALRAYAFGLLISFGTGMFMFYNGVMLGSFLTFFAMRNLLWESTLVIWIHGTLEISVIVVAGCAGFVLGNSILFPGTFPRGTSLMRGAKEGMKIVIGTVPIFIVAAFLEGFVTRHTEMPVLLSLAIIGGSAAFILWYFVWYPYHRFGQGHWMEKIKNQLAGILSLNNSKTTT